MDKDSQLRRIHATVTAWKSGRLKSDKALKRVRALANLTLAESDGSECPWRITKAAVEDYLDITGPMDPIDAEEELAAVCSQTWQRYAESPDRQPKPKRNGALAYRAPRALANECRLVVKEDPDYGATLVAVEF
jgi:hypothetical protein